MDLRQLAYFVAVVEEENFTRAAERVHVAQPGISAQIRRLERELGQPLLDRSGRMVRPTDVGVAVLPYARAALEAVDGARQVVDEHVGLLRGRVRLGMVTACGVGDVPDLLARFHQAHPAVEISLVEDDSVPLVQAVRDGSLDLALAGMGESGPEGLATRMLAEESLVAAVRPEHELAEFGSTSLEALSAYPLISLPPGNGIRSIIEDAYRPLGLQPRIAFSASSLKMQVELAGRGLGVAVVPRSTLKEFETDLVGVAIDPELRGGIGWVWRDEGAVSPACRALVTHVEGRARPGVADTVAM